MKAILTKYMGPTNFRGGRIKASDEDRNSVVLSYNHELDSVENHEAAALALCKKMNWNNVELVCGSLKNNYVFVMLSKKNGPATIKGRTVKSGEGKQ